MLIRDRKRILSELNTNFLGTLKKYNSFLLGNDSQPRLKAKLKYLFDFADGGKKYDNAVFDDIKYFLLFMCNPRSGHSLIGSILDAHPNIVISHELNVLHYFEYLNFDYKRIYSMILSNSRKLSESKSRFQTGYNYNIPYKFAGDYDKLTVIGDKQGEGNIQFIRFEPKLFLKILEIFKKNLKIICVLRNPYDNISAMYRVLKHRLSMESVIKRYFCNIRVFDLIRNKLDKEQTYFYKHESLLENPKSILNEICSFLGVEVPSDYLSVCDGIINKKPHKRRYKENWTKDDLDLIEEYMKKKDFIEYMKGYSF